MNRDITDFLADIDLFYHYKRLTMTLLGPISVIIHRTTTITMTITTEY